MRIIYSVSFAEPFYTCILPQPSRLSDGRRLIGDYFSTNNVTIVIIVVVSDDRIIPIFTVRFLQLPRQWVIIGLSARHDVGNFFFFFSQKTFSDCFRIVSIRSFCRLIFRVICPQVDFDWFFDRAFRSGYSFDILRWVGIEIYSIGTPRNSIYVCILDKIHRKI